VRFVAVGCCGCVDSHAGISKADIKFMSNQLDVLLRPMLPSSVTKRGGKHAPSDSKMDSLSFTGTGVHQRIVQVCICSFFTAVDQGSDTWVRSQKNPVGFLGTPT